MEDAYGDYGVTVEARPGAQIGDRELTALVCFDWLVSLALLYQ